MIRIQPEKYNSKHSDLTFMSPKKARSDDIIDKYHSELPRFRDHIRSPKAPSQTLTFG